MEGDTQELRASFIPAEDIRVLSNSELFSILMSSFHSFFQVGLRVGNLAEFVDLVVVHQGPPLWPRTVMGECV